MNCGNRGEASAPGAPDPWTQPTTDCWQALEAAAAWAGRLQPPYLHCYPADLGTAGCFACPSAACPAAQNARDARSSSETGSPDSDRYCATASSTSATHSGDELVTRCICARECSGALGREARAKVRGRTLGKGRALTRALAAK